MHLELSPLIVQVVLLIVNIYSEFQEYMFNNGRDMTKFLHDKDDDIADAKAIPMPQIFSDNSWAENG